MFFQSTVLRRDVFWFFGAWLKCISWMVQNNRVIQYARSATLQR